MDGYIVLKQLLDTLCNNKDLKSYTIHENSGLTVCTIRFGDSSTASNSAPERVTFRRKSRYQTQRDKARHDRYIRPLTRSQTASQGQSIENVRSEDSFLSVPGPMSPA